MSYLWIEFSSRQLSLTANYLTIGSTSIYLLRKVKVVELTTFDLFQSGVVTALSTGVPVPASIG